MEFATNNRREKTLQKSTTRHLWLTLSGSARKPGMVVVYVLRDDQSPTNPEKEWRGKVKQMDLAGDVLEVEILNRGYEGSEEHVYFQQIVRVESEESEKECS